MIGNPGACILRQNLALATHTFTLQFIKMFQEIIVVDTYTVQTTTSLNILKVSSVSAMFLPESSNLHPFYGVLLFATYASSNTSIEWINSNAGHVLFCFDNVDSIQKLIVSQMCLQFIFFQMDPKFQLKYGCFQKHFFHILKNQENLN